jgi:hypothetical protein
MKAPCLIVVVSLLLAGPAVAGTVQQWEFTFTGEDMMSVVYADGAVGSRPATDLGIFDGARLYRGVEPGYVRSYVGDGTSGDQNSGFEDWFTTADTRLGTFNLWGQDGRGEGWGEVFNSTDQGNHSSSGSWTPWDITWPSSWGTPPDSTNTFIGWDADSFDDAIGFGDGNDTNWDTSFTFSIWLDPDDWNWYGTSAPGTDGSGTPWYQGNEGELVFWFGGYELTEQGEWGRIYEGNMVLTGQYVPLPGAGVAGFALLGALGAIRLIRRRRRARA